MIMACRIFAAIIALWLITPPVAHADESRPLFLGLSETAPGVYRLDWSMPSASSQSNRPSLILPDICTWADGAHDKTLATLTGTASLVCSAPVSGHALAIHYPRYNPSLSTVFRLKTLSGEDHLGLLTPGETSWTPPQAETGGDVARQYTRLGVHHIWEGKDHLLFLVCLIWIAGDLRRVLITVTGFTLAHSLTLALSAFNIVTLPVPPVEAAIALSIVFLAREIALGRSKSLTWRHPIAVSSSFGLLHGLGFAAVLGEIGLPQTQAVTGLFLFNVGVEVGQIIFVTGVASLVFALRYASKHRLFAFAADSATRLATGKLAAYAVGVIASYWLIARTLAFSA